jgi:hypothetical protein
MGATFWVGTLVGAILSLVASVVANLFTDRIQQFISARRRIRLGNRKTIELKTYAFVKGLRSGDPVAHLELSRARDISLYSLGLGASSLLSLLVFYIDPNVERTAGLNQLLPVVLLVACLICLLVFLLTSQSISRQIKKAKDFEQYEADIRTKWGSDAI